MQLCHSSSGLLLKYFSVRGKYMIKKPYFTLKSFPLFFLKLDSYYTYLPLQTLDDGVNDDSGSAGGNIALKGGVLASDAVSSSFRYILRRTAAL